MEQQGWFPKVSHQENLIYVTLWTKETPSGQLWQSILIFMMDEENTNQFLAYLRVFR